MSVYSLQLSGSDIIGWQSSSGVPAGNVEVTAEIVAQYRDAVVSLGAERRSDRPQWVNGSVVIPPDNRPLFRLTCNRAPDAQLGVPVLEADGVDSVMVTLAKMLDADTVDESFSGPLILSTSSGRTWRFVFAGGVATKRFRTQVSGSFDVESSPAFRLVASFRLVAVE